MKGNSYANKHITLPFQCRGLCVEELIEKLKKCNFGCNINGHLISNIMYADDLVIISPSTAGLSQ